MCKICWSNPCNPRCPNYEPQIATNCYECGNNIYEGDDFYKIDNRDYCEDCIREAKKVAIRES